MACSVTTQLHWDVTGVCGGGEARVCVCLEGEADGGGVTVLEHLLGYYVLGAMRPRSNRMRGGEIGSTSGGEGG